MRWFLLFFISFSLFAIDEIRLDEPPFPGASLLVQYQGDSALCYAYTSAYLIDYERNDPNNRISPLLLAIDYKASLIFNRLKDPDFGNSCDAINSIKRIFSKSEDKDLVEEGLYYSTINHLRSLYDEHSNYFMAKEIPLPEKRIDMSTIQCSSIRILHSALGINKSFQEINTLLSSPTFISYLSRAILPTDRAISVNYKCDEVIFNFSNDNDELISKIEEALNNKKPASIGYCGRVLVEGNSYTGLTKSLFGLANTIKDDCSSHVSVVIGKRIKNGKVQYLVQDSNGTKFSYHSDLERDNGRIWIDQKTLRNNLINASYIR